VFAVLETRLNIDQLWRLGTDRCAVRQGWWHSYLAALPLRKYLTLGEYIMEKIRQKYKAEAEKSNCMERRGRQR